MTYVFVEASHDYADEFDVCACRVMEKEQLDAQLKSISKNFSSIDGEEFYFGTNDYLSFSSYKEFFNGLTITQCTKQFYEEFNNLTGNRSVGFWVIDAMLEQLEEDADDSGSNYEESEDFGLDN